MLPIEQKDLLSYRFLSGLRFAPGGGKAAFVVANANEEENCYERRLWLYEHHAIRQLTDLGQIVPIEGNVKRSERYFLAFNFQDSLRNHFRQRYAAAFDADHADVVASVIPLDDLVGNPFDRPVHRLLVQQVRFPFEFHFADLVQSHSSG
jgi:hypothetical protein